MRILGTILLVVAAAAVVVAGVAFLGLRVQPRPFPGYPGTGVEPARFPVPEGLPAPVARFYRTISGDTVPVVDSAVISGRGVVRLGGITFPTRFRFVHQAGQGYRHYMEATVFGAPLLKVNEHYLNGHARLELPGGVVENDPKVDQAANLALWAEAVAFPSLFLTDPRASWEPVDETHARLIIPFGSGQDSLTFTFDPETALIQRVEGMRWKDGADEAKTLWWGEIPAWGRTDGMLLPTEMSITWADDKGPWLELDVEENVFNTDVSDYVKARGL